jgi:hypothetical protein
MTRKVRRFAEGGDARYNRRLADIESDYAKAMARKTGRAAEVAKAKRDQRKADANDDLAKRTGADRSATRAAEKASERNLTMTRRYGAPSAVKAVESESPIASSTSVDTSKLAARGNQAISDSRTFADAFRAARKDGNQPFTWRGKSYSTAMAGETKAKPTSRAAASSASVAPAKREPPVASKLEEIVVVGRKPPSNLEEIKRKGAALRASFTGPPSKPENKASTTPTRSPSGEPLSADQQTKLSKARTQARGYYEQGKATIARNAAMSERDKVAAKMREYGVPGYAKGGKIDGCAVRGKTRAKRTK